MVKLRFKRFTAWALSFCLLFSLAQTPALALAEPTSSQALFQPLQEPITKGETYQAEDMEQKSSNMLLSRIFSNLTKPKQLSEYPQKTGRVFKMR